MTSSRHYTSTGLWPVSPHEQLVGWALIERRIADLCGVPLSVAWGGLTSHPINKSVVTIALDMLDPANIPPTFVQGDTISYTTDIERNSAICSEDTLFMLAVQYRYKTGSSALPVPLTENLRVPTADEIAHVQIMAREIERRVPEISDHLRWDVLEDRATALAARGQVYFDRVMNGRRWRLRHARCRWSSRRSFGEG